MDLPQPIIELCRAVANQGGRAWVVGGAVRDHLLGLDSKDHDVEVHRLEADDLKRVLKSLGSVNEIGRSFGVFKAVIQGAPIDVSIPRHDSQSGTAHTDIVVIGNPFMGLESAARRRDLTVNAIAYDPLTDEYRDYFGGIQDLKRGRLQAVDPATFTEDPLRALRVVQFAARFGFSVHDDLGALCRSMNLFDLPAERIWGELEKLLMKAPVPSIGWGLMHSLGIVDKVLPDIASLPATPVAAALDRAAAHREAMNGSGRAIALMVATLLHRATPLQCEATLDRLSLFKMHGYPVRKRVMEAIGVLTRLSTAADDPTLRELADTTELHLACTVAHAASGSRIALSNLDRADQLGIALDPMPTLLSGADLRKHGIEQGPQFGRILRRVRQAQIDGSVPTRDAAIIWLQDHLK